MTRKEVKALKVGDRVIAYQGQKWDAVRGVVTKCHPQGMEFDWDDGRHSVIHPDACQNIERDERAAAA